MHLRKRRTFFFSLLTLSALVFLAFPQISQAAWGSLNPNPLVVIIRDSHSRDLLYKSNGHYFYGFSKDNQVIKTGQINPKELIVKTKSPANTLAIQGQSPIASIIQQFSGKSQTLNSVQSLNLIQIPKDSDYFNALQALKNNPNVSMLNRIIS